MKTAQWVAVLFVSAGIVFGLTFFVNFLGRGSGTSKSKGTTTATQAQLTWTPDVKSFPEDPTKGPAPCELGHGQSHDFWFKNANAQALPIGVASRTCQCTSVQLWIAPMDWKEAPEVADQEEAVKKLESAGPPTELKDKEGTVEAPPGAVGVVRLAWKGDKAGPKSLAAEIWMGDEGSGPRRRFDIQTLFVSALQVSSPEISVGNLAQEKLPYDVSFKCWSHTRSEFALTASVLQNRQKSESNPFVVGEPVPWTKEEMAEMRKNPAVGPALAGYAVHVTLQKKSKDGTPFDAGIFRRRIELQTKDADPPIQVVIQGTILGDLAVAGAETGPVRLGSFFRDQSDVKQDVLVESGADVTALELDRKRTADFLGVEFLDSPEKNGGRKIWRLRVKWLPESQDGGAFPRDADDYRDSAVYIRPLYAKADGTAPSCLRIPVTGKADTPP